MIETVMDGQPGPAREMVVFNASAALWVAGIACDWCDGAEIARRAIDTGAALNTLNRWRSISNE